MTTYELRHAVHFIDEDGSSYVESGSLEEATAWLKRHNAVSLTYAIYTYPDGEPSMWLADFTCKSDAQRVLDELNKGQTT